MSQQPIDDEANLAALPLPVRQRIQEARAQRARDPYNLDELGTLNPEPVKFTVGGRELLMEELPHVELVRLQARMARLQERIKAVAGDIAGITERDVLDLDQGTREVLMGLFGPWNPDLAAIDEAAWTAAHAEWEQLPADERGPEPRRAQFAGSFFGTLRQRKLDALAEKAFAAQQGFATDELEAAREAGLDDPFVRALISRSRGTTSTAASRTGSASA